jgi:hypothetical protein
MAEPRKPPLRPTTARPGIRIPKSGSYACRKTKVKEKAQPTSMAPRANTGEGVVPRCQQKKKVKGPPPGCIPPSTVGRPPASLGHARQNGSQRPILLL